MTGSPFDGGEKMRALGDLGERTEKESGKPESYQRLDGSAQDGPKGTWEPPSLRVALAPRCFGCIYYV